MAATTHNVRILLTATTFNGNATSVFRLRIVSRRQAINASGGDEMSGKCAWVCVMGMCVWMGMRLCPIPFEIMFVLVVLVVAMPVRVLQPLVPVRVFVALPQVQPDANAHQCGGTPEEEGGHLRP